VAVIGWVITGPLAVVAILRIVAWDDLEPLAILNTITAFIYLPAWIVAIVALAGRRLVLAAVAAIIVAAQIVFMLPELTAAEPLPQWAATAPNIRLFDANVYDENRSMAGYAEEIKSFKPQLLTMEEAIPPQVAQLEKSGALAGLPYRFEVKRFDPKAFLVASKYRLSGSHVVSFDGLPLIVETTIHLPSGPQALWVVHTTAPLPSSFSQWRGQLFDIAQHVAVRGPAGLLLVGDFNATWSNKGFRTILDAGMTDAAAARGEAFDMTWSQTEHPLPPFVRIDHMLTGSGVAVTRIRTDDGPGSDHRDLMATVAFHRSAG
jgi:endonuclease/exonuclease/phosphatase (EEP) superfamily protein YafD